MCNVAPLFSAIIAYAVVRQVDQGKSPLVYVVSEIKGLLSG